MSGGSGTQSDGAGAPAVLLSTPLRCGSAALQLGVDCAVAEFTDALLRCGDADGAIIVAATAGCSDGVCWVDVQSMSVRPALDCMGTDALVVNA